MNGYKKKLRSQIQCCVVCHTSFSGAIDPLKLFCTTKCMKIYEANPSIEIKQLKVALEEKERKLQQIYKSRNLAKYPFNCKICGVLVLSSGNGLSKSHKKGICKKKCGIVEIQPKFPPRKKSTSSEFYLSRPWQELRYKVIKKYGRKCMLCNDTKSVMHVDHIKPRSKYPHLSLDINNLQVLCEPCNLGKSNLDETDWR